MGVSFVLIAETSQINDVVELVIGERLRETFGAVTSGNDIDAIEIDKENGYGIVG